MDCHVAVTLFRHGVTEANRAKRYVGWSDPPLTKEASSRLKEMQRDMPTVDYCISSDLTRCRQTAEILCPDLKHVYCDTFREMNFGRWELKTYADLCHDTAYRNWLDDPFSITPPGGESFSHMAKRVEGGWQSIRKTIDAWGYNEVLLVAHGGVMRLLLSKLADPAKRFWQWHVPHGSGVRLCWRYRDWKEVNQCTSLQAAPSTANENG